MTKSDLEKWRFRAPFVIVSNAIIPIVIVFTKNTDLETKIIQTLVLPVSWLIAFFYSAMKLRNSEWFRELDRHVGALIRNELLALIPDVLQVTEEERERLRKKEIWKKLTGVFWEAIDSDSELVRQKEHFYANGVFYTAAIDLYIILPMTSIVYSCLWIYKHEVMFLIYSCICLAVGVLSRFLILPSCRQRHLELSSEQLDLLKRKKRDFISDRFHDIVIEWREGQAAKPADAGDA
jgi:hypothetical protein